MMSITGLLCNLSKDWSLATYRLHSRCVCIDGCKFGDSSIFYEWGGDDSVYTDIVTYSLSSMHLLIDHCSSCVAALCTNQKYCDANGGNSEPPGL